MLESESELILAIEEFTQRTGKMPTKVRGRFEHLLPFADLRNYTIFMGREGYKTPLGLIECELDTKAEDWYLA